MPETVSVKSFAGGRDWKSDDGKIALTFYDCVFDRDGADFEANWGKQQGTGEPVIGESIEGEFFQKDGKWRFRKASKPQGNSQERTSGGGTYADNYTPESELDPAKVARITRSHAQEMAIRAMALYGEWEHERDLKGAITEWTDFFEADANRAAMEGGGEAAHTPASTHPAPAPSQNGQATHERIAVLLEAAGVNDVASRTIADYALTEMSPEEQDAAIEALESENRRKAAVKRLTERTEGATGQPLPRPTADEDIPF